MKQPVDKKPKPGDDKYIRVVHNAKSEEFRAIGERVHRGELKLSHFAVDGDKSYQYYLVIQKA